jgi:deoxyadenosine/deoxycytidine kinase
MIIYIEGNIGSGKSTFVKFLEKYIKENNISADILLEPVDEWMNMTDSQDTNILEYYYQDQNKYAFAFQINALISRVRQIMNFIKNSKQKIHFVERSIFTDKNVFMLANYNTGNITEIEKNIYEEWFDYLRSISNLNPDGFIYMNTNYNTCNERIIQRSRDGESGIPLEYLKSLEEYHVQWLDKEKKVRYINVLNIDSNDDFFKNPEKLQEELKKVFTFTNFLQGQKLNMC